MEVDWDLHAVVRGCNNTTAAAAPATTTSSANKPTTTSVKDDFDCKSWSSPFSGSEQSGHLFSLADPFEARNAIEELHELCKPFFPKSHEPLSPNSIICSKPVAPLFKQQQPKQPHGGGSLTNSNTANSHHTPRSKRRKNQLKRVCQVPAEGLSADVWAWRKYGQKPIKGSPYPRGYYRCSSSKGCLARKQVERNRSDPNMFIVTYTAEHNHPAPTHRNSLAGSTRQKPVTPQTITAGDSNKTPSSPSAKPTLSSSSPGTSLEEEAVPQSTKTESREIEMVDEEEDDDFGLSEVGISDDFFVGLEEFASGQRFSDDFPASFELPWTANNAATAASSI